MWWDDPVRSSSWVRVTRVNKFKFKDYNLVIPLVALCSSVLLFMSRLFTERQERLWVQPGGEGSGRSVGKIRRLGTGRSHDWTLLFRFQIEMGEGLLEVWLAIRSIIEATLIAIATSGAYAIVLKVKQTLQRWFDLVSDVVPSFHASALVHEASNFPFI